MFAFALYDNKTKELLLGRDHIGMKPLYYSITSRHIVFGSEPKVLFQSNLVSKKINKHVFFEYFCRKSPPYLHSFYQNVFEIEPGTCLKINNKKVKKKYIFYQIENGWQKIDSKEILVNKDEVLLKLKEKLISSIGKHLVSDVPIGLALSGGLDSNIILDLLINNYFDELKKFKIFTYSTLGKNNEVKIVKKILNRTKYLKHKFVKPHLSQQINNIKKLCKYFDGPVIYSSSMSMDALSKIAKEENYKVLICGQGADELFFGYTRYNYWRKKLYNEKDKIIWSNNLFFGMGINNIEMVENITGEKRNIVESSETWNWVQRNWHLPIYKRMNIFDQKFRLLHLLKRDDITGMKNSVEYRMPYLDINFINWSNALGGINKFNKSLPKKILNKEIKSIISKKKLGSIATIDTWFNSNNFFTKVFNKIKKKDSLSKNYLNFDAIHKLFNTRSSKLKAAYILTNLYYLELWFENEKNNI
jgi:asparagine synthase (glutamine-hydrolysing)